MKIAIIPTLNDCENLMQDEIGSGTYSKAELLGHQQIMEDLSSSLNKIEKVIPRGTELAYLDYPFYFNVGDHLISLGTEAFFARMGYRVSLRLSMFDLCHIDWAVPHNTRLKDKARAALSRLDPKAALVFQGGGNFGDIYPEFQMMRELVAQSFPERRIVVLPQSLHFSSPEAESRSLTRMLAHPDMHIFVRDAVSQAAVQRYRPSAGILLPDMAHALWGMSGWQVPLGGRQRILIMSRVDAESTGVQLGKDDAGLITRMDWENIVTVADKILYRLLRKAKAKDLDSEYRWPLAIWYWQRQRLVGRAVRLFGKHDRVITDRLHGTILSALLSLPVRFSDNSYGKLSRYVSAWLSASQLVAPVRRDNGYERML